MSPLPSLTSLDKPTLCSLRTVLVALAALVAGIAAASLIYFATGWAMSALATAVVVIALALLADWMLSNAPDRPKPAYAFVTFVVSLTAAHWVIRFFFVDPALGPFSPRGWNVVDALATALFGLTIFAAIGACLGLTYFAARRTLTRPSVRDGIYALVTAFAVTALLLYLRGPLLLSCYF